MRLTIRFFLACAHADDGVGASPFSRGNANADRMLETFVSTGDSKYLRSATDILTSASEIDRSSFLGRLLNGRIQLASGKYDEALQTGRKLTREMPDELDPLGLLVDSARLLGKAKEAEDAADWMLHLRPEDPRSLWRAATLREDLGDLIGAEAALVDCYKRVLKTDLFMRATLLTQMARVRAKFGRVEDAPKYLGEAKRLIPGFRPAETTSH